MNVLDLFSGIGGFSLGLERAGMRTVAFCEIDPYCRAVLRKHWPGVPIYEDVRTLTADTLRRDGTSEIDLICGGFPCQPFSTASRGRRVAKSLWPEMRRVIEELRPAYALVENVQEKAVAYAAECLRGIGYGAHYRRISGADCGADHQRDRWWAIAYPDAQSELHRTIYAEVAKLPTVCARLWGAENYARAIRVSDGVSNRVDGPWAIGNAVIPQIPEIIGRAIMSTFEKESGDADA